MRMGRSVTGVGIDIIEVARFRAIDHLTRVAELVLAPRELRAFMTHSDPALYLASRFALKESVIKASLEPLTYHDIEVRKEGKKPHAFIRGRRSAFVVSLAHSTDYVAGFAVHTS